MADAKANNRTTKCKMRVVPKSKWELPIRGSKSYWMKITEGVEHRVLRVRNPSTYPRALYPGVPLTIRSSASSASTGDITDHDFTNRDLEAEVTDTPAGEPIVKIDQPSAPSRDPNSGSASGFQSAVKFQSNREDESNDRVVPIESQWRMTKLSKMTKLVNNFLSSSRSRVRPSSAKSLTSPSRRSQLHESQGAEVTRGKSFHDPSMDEASHESSLAKMTSQEPKEKTAAGIKAARLEKRSVIFREDVEEIVERFDPNEDIACDNSRRARAPSLSIASALPSFGRVVISIESVSSIEDDDDRGKIKTNVKSTSNLTSKNRSDSMESRSKVDRREAQDLLKVPEVKTIGSSYPGYERSKLQQQSSLKHPKAEGTFGPKLRTELRVLEKKYGIWPKRSIVHVFRALKAMKQGTRSKARIESEMNRFFAVPLEIHSPTLRSSISSDDRTDFVESLSDHNDEYEERNASEENVDGGSESYASVRERLMRNAGAHIRKDIQGATCYGEDNASEATSVATDFLSFYNSRNSAGAQLKVNHRNGKTSAAACFISVPPIGRIFPRMKVDRCLACMCQSLKEINQSGGHQAGGPFSSGDHKTVSSKEPSITLSAFQCPSGESFDQSYSPPGHDDDLVEQLLEHDHPDRYSSFVSAEKTQESLTVEIPSGGLESGTSSLRSASQLDVAQQSKTIGKVGPKALLTAGLVISSLSLASEHSRSMSDQDDSDLGCVGPGGNDIRLSTGGAPKYLAPCHMPTNLRPSLEPLRALRQKRSRSIRSRVASAEKSAGSASDDENGATKVRSEGNQTLVKIDVDGIGKDSAQAIDSKRNVDVDQSQSVNESDGAHEGMRTLPSGTEPTDAERSATSLKGFYDEPIISDSEVIKIATRCLDENKTVAETLQVLAREYSNRLSDLSSQDDRSFRLPNIRKNERIARNLLTLLADSKSYLNRRKFPNEITHLSFSSKQPPLCNSRHLRRVLPLKSYNLVAPILGLPKWYPKRRASGILTPRQFSSRYSNSKGFDSVIHNPLSRMTHKVSFEEDWNEAQLKLSPYALFLTKPRRKAVIWRPLTERDLEGYDPEATLKMRAARITDKICEDFCQWLKSLAAGTNRANTIDVNVLKDMFETDFTAEICRTMQVCISEMSMVPDAVAAARNCKGAGQLAMTRRYLMKDAKAEVKPKRTVGFGTALPGGLRFVPPRNHVDERWLQCEHVPTDLETMDAVWKNITHLTSVKGFIEWLKNHPRVTKPKALEKAMASEDMLVTRQSQDMEGFKDLELDLDQIQSLKVGDNDPDIS